MSSSTTYRPVVLSEEQRAAIARQAMVARIRDRLLPELVERAQERLALAEQSAVLTAAQVASLTTTLATATEVGQVRTVVRALPVPSATTARTTAVAPPTVAFSSTIASPDLTSAPPTLTSIPPTLRGATSSPTTAGAPVDDLGWRIEEEISRARVAGADARDLGLDVAAILAEVEGLIAGARRHAAEGADGLASSHLAAVGERLDGVERRIEDRLADAEERRATLAMITGFVRQMGLDVHLASDQGGVARIRGQAGDGRSLDLRIEAGEDARQVLVAQARDMGHALPPDHPHAGDLCDPAVSMGRQLQSLIDESPDLVGGPLRDLHPPIRGHDGAVGTGARTRTGRIVTPSTIERKAP